MDPVILDHLGPPPATVLQRLEGLTGRKADEKLWRLVERLRDEAIHNGEIDDPQVRFRLRFLDFQRNLQSVNFHAQLCSNPFCSCRR